MSNKDILDLLGGWEETEKGGGSWSIRPKTRGWINLALRCDGDCWEAYAQTLSLDRTLKLPLWKDVKAEMFAQGVASEEAYFEHMVGLAKKMAEDLHVESFHVMALRPGGDDETRLLCGWWRVSSHSTPEGWEPVPGVAGQIRRSGGMSDYWVRPIEEKP
jgi:hypothetical protein